MPRLVVHEPGGVATSVAVDGEIQIGRDESMQLALHDGKVSRHHASIVRDGDGWVLVDAESRHGTFANGERVTRHELIDGDQLQIGSTLLRFEQASESSAVALHLAVTEAPAKDERLHVFYQLAEATAAIDGDAGRQRDRDAGGSPRRVGIPQGPAGGGRRRPVPAGPLLPARGSRDRDPAAARARCGRRRARRDLPRADPRAAHRTVADLERRGRRADELRAWPGNVRELRHAIERACAIAQGDTIEATDLALHSPIAAAARLLGITRIMMKRRLDRFTGE